MVESRAYAQADPDSEKDERSAANAWRAVGTTQTTTKEEAPPLVGEQPVHAQESAKNTSRAARLLQDVLQPVDNPMHLPPSFGPVEEVMMHPRIFRRICLTLQVTPQIDLFA